MEARLPILASTRLICPNNWTRVYAWKNHLMQLALITCERDIIAQLCEGRCHLQTYTIISNPTFCSLYDYCANIFRYSLMMKCWDSEANLRPSFAELVKQLSGLLGVMAEYIDLSASQTAETEM